MLAIKANSLDCVGRVTNKEIGTAFKEWAIVCDALGKGQQSIIFRKGGIHEGKRGFQFKHDQLYTKKGFKGMHGEFFIEKNLSKHKLKIYKVLEKKFVKVY